MSPTDSPTPGTHPAFRTILGVVFVLFASLSCGDYAGLTDVDSRDPSATDSLLPDITIETLPSDFEVGDEIEVHVTDDSGVERLAAFILDDDDQVLWASDTATVDGLDDVTRAFAVDGLPSGFPYGEEVHVTAWAQDVVGKARFMGAPEETPLRLSEALTVSLIINEGQTVVLGQGSRVGDFVWNWVDQEIYFTNTTENYVGGFSVEDMEEHDWRILVGSQPTKMAFRPYAWGSGPTLAVFNSGGTEVSVVDLTNTGGGSERWRIVLPIIRVSVEGDTLDLETLADPNSVILQCPDDVCDRPDLYMATPRLDSEDPGVTHTLSITAPSQIARFDVLTPRFSPELSSDSSVTVEAFQVSRETGGDSLIFRRSARSKCGTFAFGSVLMANSDERGGSFYIAETGEAGGACGTGGRLLRFDRDDGEWVVNTSGIVNFDFDPGLSTPAIRDLDVNHDGSLLALASGESVILTDGSLRRLATFDVSASAVALLEGQTGGTGPPESGALLAVATGSEIVVYETEHFTELARYATSAQADSPLLFVRTDGQDGVAFLAVNETRTGLIVLSTSIDEILARSER